MPDEVTLDLRENFVRDEVVVSVGGREVVRVQGVTTRTQIGLARSVTVPLGASPAALDVLVPALGVRGEARIPETRPLWIGVSLTPARDRLEFIIRTDAFGYV